MQTHLRCPEDEPSTGRIYLPVEHCTRCCSQSQSPRNHVLHTSWPFFLTLSSHFYKNITVLLICYFMTILAASSIPGTAAIDCFKCVSLNGNNPSCEDPFHNNYSVSILESPCMGGRKGRNGLFPATACIKLADDTGETITVRGCALDSGTLNVDTEITRMSHCGSFWFEARYVKGCLQSCDDADGCNSASKPAPHFPITSLITALLVIFLLSGCSSSHIAAREFIALRRHQPPPPPQQQWL